jgi:hypothetical protein
MTHNPNERIATLSRRLYGSPRYRKLWLGVVVLRALVLAPSALADEPAPRAVATQQKLSVEEVRIEGKLYSPQALFIVTRSTERFGRDAIVPHVLQHDPAARLFPFQLDEALLAAKRDVVRGESPAPLTTKTPSRRSP